MMANMHHGSHKSRKKNKKRKNHFPKNRLSRREIKKHAVEYKGGKCEICGYNKCLSALTFHHLDPTQKRFNISELANLITWDKLLKEINKTALVCTNCHCEINEGLVDGYLDGYI